MTAGVDLELLRRERIVAILRATDDRHLAATVQTLVESGIHLVEISLSTPGALAALERLRRNLPSDARLGTGTVTTAAQVRESVDAGADFLVTPTYSSVVLAEASRRGVPVLCGALTPTEILGAHETGALAVKVFPASTFGPSYCRALLQPLPHVPLVPTGGVDIDNAREFIDAGAVAVGVAGWLVGDATEGGSLAELSARAHRLLEAVS